MVTLRNLVFGTLGAAALLFPALLEAQAGPFTDAAELKLSSNRNTISAGDRVDIRVDVDLSSIQGRRANGTSTPAVLGGYVIQVSFDRSRLRFDSAKGGAVEFNQEPTYRMPALANASGTVAIAGVHASSESPSGRVHVATLSFTAVAGGTATVTAVADSLSSAFQFPASGPASISASGAELAMGIQASGVLTAQLPTTIIPVVGSLAGGGGSFFRSSIQLYNGGTMPIAGRMLFYPRGVSSTKTGASMGYFLAPGQRVDYPDVVAAMGGTGLGTLDIVADSGSLPIAFARLFNDHGNGGRSSMAVDGIKPEDAFAEGSRTVLLVPADLQASRFNLGIRTLDEGATVKVSVADRDGRLIRTTSKAFPAHFFDQMAANVMVDSTLQGGESLIIDVEKGSAIIYGAQTDNKTQDPTMRYARLLPVE